MPTPLIDELEPGFEAPADGDAVLGSRRVAILIVEPVNRRLVESASIQLELIPHLFENPLQVSAALLDFELIVADESLAPSVRESFTRDRAESDSVSPAVVAVRPSLPLAEQETASADLFDGVLNLPAQPAQVTAQLSLILYAHRAFARRFRDALEELNLNRRIFRSVTSGISVADATLPDLPLVYVNPAFEVMTGYSLEEVQGKNCRFLQGPERSQPEIALIRQALAGQREILTTIRNFRKDGTPFWNELSLSPIRNREGVLTHFVGIQTDITARVEFEAALRESEKLAAVGRLASSIAHEINNPLESVTNLLYLAQHANDADEMLRYVVSADKELRRVALITSQSLRFYKQSTRPQPTLVNELVESVLDLYGPRALNAGVTIERRERSLRPVVCMESEIRQVLSNLLRNALDATQAGRGKIVLRTQDGTHPRTGEPGVFLTMADTGSGISEESLAQIYKPFFSTKGIAGTGLGLWISKEIVERHGGLLRVRSSQRAGRHGTVFLLFLPAGAAGS